MLTPELRLVYVNHSFDLLHTGSIAEVLNEVAQLAGVQLEIINQGDSDPVSIPTSTNTRQVPIKYRNQLMGHLFYPADAKSTVETCAHAIGATLEYMMDREMAIADLADAMNTSYEELNMLYSLLPNLTAKTEQREIGEALIEQTTQTLGCRRASLLVVDEDRKNLRVLASRGLPAEVKDIQIPISDSIAGHVLLESDLLVVNDISTRPDLVGLSRGKYDSAAFVVVRMPLHARGEAVGILTATERIDSAEFSARDHKLLEGLSAMGASALLNCQLHEAANRQMISTIQALASAVDAKDSYTHDHSGRVAELCVATARELGITDPTACREVELAGLLHDVGKIGIADAILSKPGPLTTEEFAVIKTHAEISAKIVGKVHGLEKVAKAILHHHERYDGLGYPTGLSGDEIPVTSKLITVCDIFDSLASDRPYRKAMSIESVLSELTRGRGTQSDPTIIDAFLAVISRADNASSKNKEQALAT